MTSLIECLVKQKKIIKTNFQISTENMISNAGGIIPTYKININNKIGFEKNDVLYSGIRPYFRKVWFALCEGNTNQDVKVFYVNKNILHPKYFYYILNTSKLTTIICSNCKGTKMPRVDWGIVLQTKVNLPNKKMQKRIIDKVCP